MSNKSLSSAGTWDSGFLLADIFCLKASGDVEDTTYKRHEQTQLLNAR
jgi:hypothetical protein